MSIFYQFKNDDVIFAQHVDIVQFGANYKSALFFSQPMRIKTELQNPVQQMSPVDLQAAGTDVTIISRTTHAPVVFPYHTSRTRAHSAQYSNAVTIFHALKCRRYEKQERTV